MAGGIKLKDHTILSLDIGSRFIKVAELRLSKGKISLLNAAVRPTPVGVLDNSQILDPVALGRAIRELLTAHKITTRRVVVAVARQSSVVVRPIDLPKMSRKELRDTMKFEVERHVPFAVDEIVMDYAPIGNPDELPETESNMKVLLAVAQEELINAYLKVLSVAGLQPVAMDVEVLSAMRALVDIRQADGAYDEAVALVNIGAGSTDISVISKGQLTFTRSVPIAGDALSQAIAEQLGRTMEEAEELKKEYGSIFMDSAFGELPAPQEDALGAPMDGADADSSFFAFGAGNDGLPWAQNTPQPQQVFSLDDDFSASSAFSLDEDPPVAASPFQLGEPEAEPTVQPLQLGEQADEPEAPVFRFGEDEPPTAPASQADAGGMSPVFDLSSELEQQMPTPLARPSRPAEEPVPFFGAADTANPFSFGDDAANQADAAALEATQFIPNSALDAAPAFERPDVQQGDVFQRRVFEAMLPTLGELVTEIRRSLEYYTSREPDVPVERIVIYGGTSRLPNLAEFIRQEVGVEVRNAAPLEALDLSYVRQPADYIEDVAPALPVCIGLGLRDMIA